MDISTVNVIIGATATFIGAIMLFVLGAIMAYVRNINKSMKELLVMSTEHKARIDMMERQIEDLYKKVGELYSLVNELVGKVNKSNRLH